MGRSPGPPKTPTALALLRNNPGRRPLPPDEPTPPLAKDEPPTDLEPRALEIWRARVPGLVACALIAWVDVGHVARACRLEAKADELWQQHQAQPVELSRLGDKRQAPGITTALALYAAADAIWYRLGITPSERTRLRSRGPEGPTDPLGQHLGARPPAPRAVRGGS